MRFGEVETALILAAYGANQPNRSVSSGELMDRFVIDPSEGWIHQIVADLGRRGILYGKGVMGDERSQPIKLTAAGMRLAESLIDEGKTVRERSVEMVVPETTLVLKAPASDRIVRLDHNRGDFEEVVARLSEIKKAVRESNSLEVPDEERDRISRSLDAASTIWQAAQLKIIQLKVGVLMAAEDAAKALTSTGKAIAAALLVDTIKAVVKAHTGVDLDHI